MGNVWIRPWANFAQYMDRTLKGNVYTLLVCYIANCKVTQYEQQVLGICNTPVLVTQVGFGRHPGMPWDVTIPIRGAYGPTRGLGC